MSWSAWERGPDAWFKTKQEGGWVHWLIAHPDSTSNIERDNNHIHVKWGGGETGAAVLCAVKIDGLHKINRRELIDIINRRCPGLNLNYR